MSITSRVTVPDSDQIRVRTKGHYTYGFTILPNVLRDVYLPRLGPDGFTLAYLILSWAGDGDRGAALGARYLKATTGMSSTRVAGAKSTLLAEMGDVFSMTPGVKETSTPETWWVDLATLMRQHAVFLEGEEQRRARRRGPGRPRKPVPGIGTGFSGEGASARNPVPGINTGFSGWARNPVPGISTGVFRKSEQGCVDSWNTPVPEIGTHKDITKISSKELSKKEEERRALTVPPGASSPSDVNTNEPRDAARAARASARTEATAVTVPEPTSFPASAGSHSPTTIEEVPGPAAAAEARELLERYLGGARRFAQYMAEVPASGADRRRWLDRLTAERVLEIVEDARSQKVLKFHTYILQALDVEVGANLVLPGRTVAPVVPERRPLGRGDVVVYFGERLRVANDPGDYTRGNARILLQTLDGQPAYVVLGDDWRKIRHVDPDVAPGGA